MRTTLLIAAALYTTGVLADDLKSEAAPALLPDPASVAAAKAPDLTKLQAALNGEKPDRVVPSAIPGLFEVVIGGQVLYVSQDGHFVVQGDLVDLGSRTNLTEARRGQLRGQLLNTINEKDMIIFGPAGPVRHTITVFTDIDCGYCRKMHSQMAEYNKEGIKIRYLLFPREGIGSDSYTKAVSVWCATNRQDAMTRAKRGEAIESKSCENPVKAQYELGQKIGVQGTPSIILDDGGMLPGYVPPTQLAQMLTTAKDQKAGSKNPP